MKVNFGHDVLEYPSETFGQLRDSSDLLADPAALRMRMAEDGYLLMRGLIDRQRVLEARRSILHYMAEHEAMEKGSRPLDGVMGQYGKSVSMMGRRRSRGAGSAGTVRFLLALFRAAGVDL
jgi:hypothetical protein